MTSTLSASAGASRDVAKIVRTVGTATKTMIATGARVQAISISMWPCVGWGAGRPSRWRNRAEYGFLLGGRGRIAPACDEAEPADALHQFRREVQRVLERPVADLVQLVFDRAQPVAQPPGERAQTRRVRRGRGAQPVVEL